MAAMAVVVLEHTKLATPRKDMSHTENIQSRKVVKPVQFRSPTSFRILVVIPFCPKDSVQALLLLNWISELGGCREFDCLLLHACQTPASDVAIISETAKLCFNEVIVRPTTHQLANEKWPIGPNWMFRQCLMLLAEDHRPFLWLEPDCFPLCPNWLYRYNEEYCKTSTSSQKTYMGCIVEEMEGCPRHLTGCAIYPGQSDTKKELIEYTKGSTAWDVACAEFVLPYTHHTFLHYHHWGHGVNGSPKFVDVPSESPREVHIVEIPTYAVLGHRCKDGSAIACLRRKMWDMKMSASRLKLMGNP